MGEKGQGLSFPATPVWLNLYDLGTSCAGQALNQFLRPLGSPALHCGVEVFQHEWSYCHVTLDGEASMQHHSGVFSCKPRECANHTYSQSLRLGSTTLSQGMFTCLINYVKTEWPSSDYDVFSRNCCHFAEQLSLQLGVGELPAWVMRLSDMGSAVVEIECTSPDSVLCCGPFDQGEVGLRLPPRRDSTPSDLWRDDLVMALSMEEEAPDGCYAAPGATPNVSPRRPGPGSPRRFYKKAEEDEVASERTA